VIGFECKCKAVAMLRTVAGPARRPLGLQWAEWLVNEK